MMEVSNEVLQKVVLRELKGSIESGGINQMIRLEVARYLRRPEVRDHLSTLAIRLSA